MFLKVLIFKEKINSKTPLIFTGKNNLGSAEMEKMNINPKTEVIHLSRDLWARRWSHYDFLLCSNKADLLQQG